MITLDMNNERYDITCYVSIITYVTITYALLCETINLGDRCFTAKRVSSYYNRKKRNQLKKCENMY